FGGGRAKLRADDATFRAPAVAASTVGNISRLTNLQIEGKVPPKHSNQFDHHPMSNQRRRPLQARQRDVVLRVENAVDLGAAGLEQCRHARLRNLFLLHGLGELPGHNFLDRLRLRFFEDVFLLQEVVDTRSQMFLAHCSNSFWRLRASAKSASRVARVFLIKPCSATRRCWYCQINTRAVRFPGAPVTHSPRNIPTTRPRG